jgi:hypothetical protein
MSDLVKRLREPHRGKTEHEAADEIERLQRQVAAIWRAIIATYRNSQMWQRKPGLDKRIARGDDFAGDAWINMGTGEVRYVAVGQSMTNKSDCHAEANDE